MEGTQATESGAPGLRVFGLAGPPTAVGNNQVAACHRLDWQTKSDSFSSPVTFTPSPFKVSLQRSLPRCSPGRRGNWYLSPFRCPFVQPCMAGLLEASV